MQFTVYILVLTLLLAGWIWGSLAIYVAGPEQASLRYGLLIVFILLLPVIFYLVKPFWMASVCSMLVFSVLYLWWASLIPTNTKDWFADVAQTAHGELNGDHLVLNNIRNTDYRSLSDYTPHWETRDYDLSQLETLDIFLSYWGSPHVAHIIMSWGFSNGEHLAISIETRKVKGQKYSELKGFFKQYTLTYIAGDEQDLIRLRTNHRKEHVYFYRIQNIPLEYKRELLKIYFREMNTLHEQPKFYHALLKNCTSGISRHFKTISPNSTLIDWRLIANGHLDELLYELRLIRRDIPFVKLRELSRIDLRMQKISSENFSKVLREGLVLQ